MGTLYVVATPIGNLSDVTDRARAVLGAVQTVVAEDTRRTRKLLAALGVSTRLVSLHAHSGARKLDRVAALLEKGDVAYVTDAGTPGVSDPGAALVSAARRSGHTVSPVPGPSALAAALSVCGIEAAGAVLLGFLPPRPARRRSLLERAAALGLPVVVFAPPSEVGRVITDCAQVMGPETGVVVCRELTKLHEEVVESTLARAPELSAVEKARGEYVLVISPAARESKAPSDEEVTEAVRRLRQSGLTLRDAAARAAAELGVSRNRAYRAGVGHSEPGRRPRKT